MNALVGGEDAVQAHSRLALREGSKSFDTAALLLDPLARDSARLLYAWCRYCDDVIDGQHLGFGNLPGEASPTARLQQLRDATIRAHGGERQDDPVFAAFQRVAARHDIPLAHPLALLDGFAMDVERRRYRTLEDTLLYCYHVAGVVGLMMARILGVRDEAVLDRACDLGLGFQLTNIARDVMDDWRNGRVYLPEAWLERAGITPETLGEPRHATALAGVVAELLAAAEPYYASAAIGARALPLRSAWAINTAAGVYRAIGTRVLAAGGKAWRGRVVVSPMAKLALAAAALGTTVATRPLGADQAPRSALLWSRPR